MLNAAYLGVRLGTNTAVGWLGIQPDREIGPIKTEKSCMLGLVVTAILFAYIVLTVLVSLGAAKFAKKINHGPWLWGGLAAFAMYNLVFWDFIPTLVLHKYYCATHAGYWVYKAPGEWVAENPGAAESLTWKPQTGYLRSSNVLNERFSLENNTREMSSLLPIRARETTVRDTRTGEAMLFARGVFSGYGSFAVGGERSWRFWTSFQPCTPYPQLKSMIEEFERLGTKVE